MFSLWIRVLPKCYKKTDNFLSALKSIVIISNIIDVDIYKMKALFKVFFQFISGKLFLSHLIFIDDFNMKTFSRT